MRVQQTLDDVHVRYRFRYFCYLGYPGYPCYS